MKALIVAAGRGSRLGDLSDQTPKCLTPFAGSRLLDMQLGVLRGAGLDNIHLVRGYLGEQLDGLGLSLWDNPDWASTNMVASMLCARPLLEEDDDLIVAYGDIVYERRVLQALLNDRSGAGVVVDRKWLDLWNLRSDSPLADAESLRLDQAGNIIDIGKKVSGLEEIEAQYIGLMRFSADTRSQLLGLLDQAQGTTDGVNGKPVENCYMTDLLQAYVDIGGLLHAVPIDGGWLEFDTADDIARYAEQIRGGSMASYCDVETLAAEQA